MSKQQQNPKENPRTPKPNPRGKKGGKGSRGVKPPYTGKKFGSGSKDERREEEVADTAAAMSKSNPIDFYIKYKEFALDASKLPFSLPLGANYDVQVMGQTIQHTIPGLMRIGFAPTVGVSADFSSPMNRSSTNFYARIRSKQRAFGNYDHQDVTMMVQALDSCCMFHALGRRLYGVMRDMSPTNRYYPRAIISAHGVQFPNSQKEIQDFRAWLNSFAIRIEQYAIPDNIELIKRHQWMCEGLYTDSTSVKAQTYMFVPTGFWKYNNTVATGSQLDWVPFLSTNISSPTQLTIQQFEDIGESLINAMSNEADFALISGDMYAYYENAHLMKLPYVSEDYAILPSYDEIVLSQIENATVMGDWDPNYTPLISQNPSVNQGAIIFKPYMKSPKLMGATNPLAGTPVVSLNINMHHDSPTPEQVMEATRLMTITEIQDLGSGAPSSVSQRVVSCASEIVQYMDIFSVNPATQAFRIYRINSNTQYFDGSDSETVMTNGYAYALMLAKFDWCPRVHYYHNTGDETSISTIEYIGDTWDTDNMNELRNSYLATIHEAALYSLFSAET